MTLLKSIHKFKEIFWLPLVLIHLVLLVNTKFTLWPEIVVYPYLANHGFLLYRDIINPYTPAFLIFLNLFAKVFGYLPLPYQIFSWVIIVFCDISIFIVALKISKNYYNAALATLFFVLFSVSFGINTLWFDLVQTPFLIFSFYYFYKYLTFKKVSDLQISFCLSIVVFFIKQQVIWLVIFYLASLIVREKTKLFKIVKKLFLPFALFCFLLLLQIVYLYKLGTLGDFIFWTIYEPFVKSSSLPGYVLLPTIKQILIILTPVVIASSVAIYSRAKNLTLVTLPLPFILFAYPRFDYFHLISYLAVTSILIGTNFKMIKNSQRKMLIFPVALTILLAVFAIHFIKSNWHKPVRFFERDIFQAATFLEAVTPKNVPIYIQNGPDQLYPLSGRLPVKPWIDEFPWYLEVPGQQQKVVSSLKSQSPTFLVFKPYDQKDKYGLGSYRPTLIANYLDENYQNLIQINSSLWLKIKK